MVNPSNETATVAKEAQALEVSSAFKWIISIVAALVILLGIYPQLLFSWFYF